MYKQGAASGIRIITCFSGLSAKYNKQSYNYSTHFMVNIENDEIMFEWPITRSAHKLPLIY